MADPNQTIIIKKIKKGGHGHHGGAWKVAYADFVTAMMAFFLLLWLLASTSEDKLKGLADYFTPTIGLKDAMGIGVQGGLSPIEGTSKSEMMPPGVLPGQTPQGPIPQAPKDSMVDAEAQSKLFEAAQEALKQAIEADANLRDYSENIVMEQSPEGIKLSLRDDERRPMYLPASAELSPHGQKILKGLLPLIKKMPNLISLTGHTDVSSLEKPNYTNWELSSDRANSARRYLVLQGLNPKQMGKVVGRADQELLLPEAPNAPQNRRLEIIMLRGSYLNQLPQNQVVPRPLMNAPRAQDTLSKMQQSAKKNEAPKALSGDAKETRKPNADVPSLPGVIKLEPGARANAGGQKSDQKQELQIPEAPSLLPSQKPETEAPLSF